MSRFAWRRASAFGLGIVLVAAGIQRALTCWGPMFDAVHFNDAVPDFGVPPQDVAISWWTNAPLRPGTIGPTPDSRWEAEEARQAAHANALQRLIRDARAAERAGRYRTAVARYRKLMVRAAHKAAAWQDRIEVLQQALMTGKPQSFRLYIAARNVYESQRATMSDLRRVRRTMLSIAENRGAGFLRGHALYTVSAIAWDLHAGAACAPGFERCADLCPESPRAESALIMAVRALLGKRTHRTVEIPHRDVASGRRILAKLLERYPHTRFKTDAIGWLGRVDYLMGRYDKAIARYRRQLRVGGPRFRTYDSIAECYCAKGRRVDAFAAHLVALARAGAPGKEEVACNLRADRASLTPRDAAPLARRLIDEPALLQPYLEFRLHFTSTSHKDLVNLVQLSDRCLRRRPHAELSASILARLAEICYIGKRYARARTYAEHSLSAHGQGADLALYVQAAALNRLGHRRQALAVFERLVRQHPKSFYVGGAKENLALLYEKAGRLGDALDQYSKLNYRDDVAYLLDVRMTPKQIEDFIDSHPTHSLRKTAIYALGMRYLRKDRFASALRWFGKLSRKERRAFADVGPHPKGKYFPFQYEESSKLFDPLATAGDLARLHSAYKAAEGSQAKAKAIYALASYYHKRRNLLLYNPSVWHGLKTIEYEIRWNRAVETRADRLAWREHSYEHDCLARTRALCLEILHRYPGSRVAPQAAYTAGVACMRLADLNEWWRQENKRSHFDRQAIHLMKLVVRRYPRSKVAKAARKYADVYSSEADEREHQALFDR